MDKIPFEIPESLQGYLKTFGDDPERGIANLEQYLSKRRIDAVGFFLLAILYKMSGREQDALRTASRARSLAPGSHLLENLHYFLRHPDGFEAWVPEFKPDTTPSVRKNDSAVSTMSVDLDNLIDRLTRVGSKRIKSFDLGNAEAERGNDESVVHELATPTLAKIYEAQGKAEDAIRVYRQLMNMKPDKSDEYMVEITRLENGSE